MIDWICNLAESHDRVYFHLQSEEKKWEAKAKLANFCSIVLYPEVLFFLLSLMK